MWCRKKFAQSQSAVDVRARAGDLFERCPERGLAIGEMLVLTIPLSLLSLALTSRLSTTGTRRLDSLTNAAAEAQHAARGAAGCPAKVDLADIVMLGDMAANSRIRKSLLLQAPAIAVVLPTGNQTRTSVAAPSSYHFTFSKLAEDFAPDSIDKQSISSSATFLCNEPIGDGETKKWELGAWVFGNGLWQARKLFTGKSSGTAKSEKVERPVEPPEVDDSRGDFKGSYRKGQEKKAEEEEKARNKRR